jgi:hypothetical protein
MKCKLLIILLFGYLIKEIPFKDLVFISSKFVSFDFYFLAISRPHGFPPNLALCP